LAEKIIRKYGAELLKKKNVVGFEHQLQKRIRKGKEVDELCFVVYVTRKVSELKLAPKDIIPRYLDDIPVDVVEIGELKALPRKKAVDKRKTFRPLVAGISIGHRDITAGTLGWFVEDAVTGETLLASNAHVFTPDPSKPAGSFSREIYQPGPSDGGHEMVALYRWHERIEPLNNCKLARWIVDGLNWISKVFGRKTRFELLQPINNIDFAVADPYADFEVKFVDTNELPDPFVGFGFAGSEITSVICKIQHIVTKGYRPIAVEVCDNLERNDKLRKTGRTSCKTDAKVIGTSATVRVSYGSFEALFTDVILTSKLLEPGDSGSAVWKVVR